MNNTISNNLIQYFRNNSSNSLKFIRNLVKNMNNSRNLSNTVDKKEKSYGYAIGLYSVSGLYNNPKEFTIGRNRKYFIRYFFNMYNSVTRQQYGNTYRSPLLPIKIGEDNYIELLDKKAFFVYVLSQEPKNENLVVQIVLVETTDDEVILKEKCEGWTLLKLSPKSNDNENENDFQFGKIQLELSKIYIGTPRELIFKNNQIQYGQALISYYPYKYKKLELINFLLPNFIILGYNEPLPGLRLRNLPQTPNLNENLRIVDFLTIYVKNINIEINSTLERDILEFGREYRIKKYEIEENQTNKVYIKERKIKCGIHNTWKFINSNGLQNSITLTKISKNILESNGVLMVDRCFSDPLSCAGIIMELEYNLVVPINGEQKEDNLSLILGYHIYVPEKMIAGNYYREKNLMFTGPGLTIYGDKMWYPQNLEDREIKISYLLSQNANLSYTSKVEQENEVNKERLNALQKTFVDQNNQMILSGLGQNKEQLDHISELEKTVNNLKKQLKFVEDDKERQLLQFKQKELLLTNPNKMDIKSETVVKNIPKPDKPISKEESLEYQQFLEFKQRKETFQKQLEDQELRLKELEKPVITQYEPIIKNISARDKSTLISKGVLDLVLSPPVDSYIDLALDKELCKHGLATIFKFKFLTFKPSKAYYKELRLIPDKIQFFFDFFNEKKLHTSVCNVMRPENSGTDNFYYFNNPLVLKKENINSSSTLLNDSKDEISIEVRYDPSLDISIDFRDFVKYLLTRRLVIQIKDVIKCLNIGCIKIPLKDLIVQGKEEIKITKEYPIYDDDFKRRGYIQLVISSSKFNTIKPYSYNKDIYKLINSSEGYNTLSKKKVVRATQIDVNKLMATNKNLVNYTVTNLNDPNNQGNITDTQLLNDMNSQSRLRRLKIDPELEKKIRVMRYFSNKANFGNSNTNNMNNTNYSLGGNILNDEKRANELRQKQSNENQFLNTLKTCEQIRDFNRYETLSKVSQESHKNVYNISLIVGQPLFFNYSVFNDSSSEETFHIVIEKIKNNKKNNNSFSERYIYKGKNEIISVIHMSQEWSAIVEKEKLIKPNTYNVISDDLYMKIKAGETIPLVIKLLSFIENKEEDNYSICIRKKNDQPLYFLNINIKRVFPIYDHIFHYYFPCDNKYQKGILVNPFKNSKTKTMDMLNNLYISDDSIHLALEDDHNFSFNLIHENNIYQHDFIIFIYSDVERTKLYLTWKVEVDWKEVLEIHGIQGLKTSSSLLINYESELYKESTYNGNNMNLQLFTDHPDTIYFPQGYDMPFVLFPNNQAKSKFILYPKSNEGNLALINCVNVYTRELYKSWIIKYTVDYPKIDETEQINCVVGSQNIINYRCTNPFNKWTILMFYSGDDRIMEVIDRVNSFNIGETKQIKILIHERGNICREEVLLFISDRDDEYCKTLLFIINFRENN